MDRGDMPRRLARLPRASVIGFEVPVAETLAARLLGLAMLDAERAGTGLLIPRCRSVHTFGMRFPLDVFFLDPEDVVLEVRMGLPPRRVARCAAATAVLELPASA